MLICVKRSDSHCLVNNPHTRLRDWNWRVYDTQFSFGWRKRLWQQAGDHLGPERQGPTRFAQAPALSLPRALSPSLPRSRGCPRRRTCWWPSRSGKRGKVYSAGEKLDFSHGKVPGSCLKVEASPLGCGSSDGGELGDECFSVGVGTLRHSHLLSFSLSG